MVREIGYFSSYFDNSSSNNEDSELEITVS